MRQWHVVEVSNAQWNKITQGAHSQILMMGRSDRNHIFYPKKSQLQNFSTQKITAVFNIPKKIPWSFFLQPKNIPLIFFATQKNPGIFHRPKKITFGQNFRIKKITGTPLSLKYVSGAPGENNQPCFKKFLKGKECLFIGLW